MVFVVWNLQTTPTGVCFSTQTETEYLAIKRDKIHEKNVSYFQISNIPNSTEIERRAK